MTSFEIVNEKLETGDIVTIVTKDYWLMTKEELETIKQDLESYKNVMELIKELFKNIDTIDIFGKHVFICKVNGKSFQIDRPTQKVLQELKKAGDSQ